MTQFLNRAVQKELRQQLRKTSPEPERKLWLHLRNRQFEQLKFRRQYGMGPFIVDFCCPELRLVIEIDGDSHFDDAAIAYDREREYFIGQLVFRWCDFQMPMSCKISMVYSSDYVR